MVEVVPLQSSTQVPWAAPPLITFSLRPGKSAEEKTMLWVVKCRPTSPLPFASPEVSSSRTFSYV